MKRKLDIENTGLKLLSEQGNKVTYGNDYGNRVEIEEFWIGCDDPEVLVSIHTRNGHQIVDSVYTGKVREITCTQQEGFGIRPQTLLNHAQVLYREEDNNHKVLGSICLSTGSGTSDSPEIDRTYRDGEIKTITVSNDISGAGTHRTGSTHEVVQPIQNLVIELINRDTMETNTFKLASTGEKKTRFYLNQETKANFCPTRIPEFPNQALGVSNLISTSNIRDVDNWYQSLEALFEY